MAFLSRDIGSASSNDFLIQAVCGSSITDIKKALKKGADINYVTPNGDFALLHAAKQDLIAVVRFLIKKGANVNLQNEDGKTALMESSYHASLRVTELLLNKGAKVNLRSKDGESALILACRSNKVNQLQADCVEALVNHAADINMQDERGWTALMRACGNNYLYHNPTRIVSTLLNHGARVDFMNSNGKTALMVACANSTTSVQLAELLLAYNSRQHINMKDKDGQSALIIACRNNLPNHVSALIQHGADVNMQDDGGWSALMRACEKPTYSIIKCLLRNGADVNLQDSQGQPALMTACEIGLYDCAKMLINSGANVNLRDNNGQTALMKTRDTHIVRLLLECGADVDLQDNDGRSALLIACESFEEQIVYDLLLANANANLKTKNGLTPLMIACSKGSIIENFLIMKHLLNHGATVNSTDNEGKSALMHVTSGEHAHKRDIAYLLLQHRANVNLQDKEGKSALIVSCEKELLFTRRLLLQYGANPDLQDSEGFSALMRACEKGYKGIMFELLSRNAGKDLQSKSGLSALIIACQKGFTDIVELLLRLYRVEINNIDRNGRSALMHALTNRSKDAASLTKIVHLLLEHEANVSFQDKRGKSALILACENKEQLSLEQYGLLNNTVIDLQDNEGFSALMRACENGKQLIVYELLSSNADVNLVTNKGETALMIACKKGFRDIVELFLYLGVEVDSTDKKGRSALMHASEHGHTDVVKLLLDHSASINTQDQHGNSALMTACEKGHLETSSILLKSEADVYLKNSEGQSALDLAKDNDTLTLFTKVTTDPSLPGILFLAGGKREKVVNNHKTINLEEEGITVSIPEDALPSTDPPLDIQVRPCFSGPFEVPEDLELVSPVYIVKPSREVKFRKEVLVKIWHHANLETEEDCEDMVFLSASTTPEYRGTRPAYVFREIRGVKGLFRPGEEQPVGEIALKHFCGMALGKRKRKNSDKDVSSQKRSKGNLYSVRLYGTIERKIIFCVCLYQPHYIRILKDDIDSQEKYDIEDLIDMDYPPQVVIRVRNPLRTVNLAPLRLYVEGLNKDFSFVLQPGDFHIHSKTTPTQDQAMGHQVKHLDTSEIKHALGELKEEVQQQSYTSLSTSSGNANVSLIHTSTQMLLMMENIESMIHDRNCTEIIVTKLNELKMKTQQLKQETKQICDMLKVNYDVAIHVETTNMLAVQLKMNYMANKRHSTTSEWEAAMSVFITNSANLMRSIRKVLVASKYALAIPNNVVTPLTPTTPTVPPQHQLLTQLQAVTSASQQTPQSVPQVERRAFQPQLPTTVPPSFHYTHSDNNPTLAASNYATMFAYPHPTIHTPSLRSFSSSTIVASSQAAMSPSIISPYLGSRDVSSSMMTVHRDQQQHGCVDASSFTSHDLLPELNTGPAPVPVQAQHFIFPPALPAETTSAQLECATSALSPTKLPQSPGFKVQSPHQCLCIQDTKEVRHCLDSLTAQWEYIAIELDISPDTIDIIKANHQDIRARLLEVIKLWLRQTTPPPTWQALADAVQYIDSNKAQEIRHKIS